MTITEKGVSFFFLWQNWKRRRPKTSFSFPNCVFLNLSTGPKLGGASVDTFSKAFSASCQEKEKEGKNYSLLPLSNLFPSWREGRESFYDTTGTDFFFFFLKGATDFGLDQVLPTPITPFLPSLVFPIKATKMRLGRKMMVLRGYRFFFIFLKENDFAK